MNGTQISVIVVGSDKEMYDAATRYDPNFMKGLAESEVAELSRNEGILTPPLRMKIIAKNLQTIVGNEGGLEYSGGNSMVVKPYSPAKMYGLVEKINNSGGNLFYAEVDSHGMGTNFQYKMKKTPTEQERREITRLIVETYKQPSPEISEDCIAIRLEGTKIIEEQEDPFNKKPLLLRLRPQKPADIINDLSEKFPSLFEKILFPYEFNMETL